MLEEQINNLPLQFSYNPEVTNPKEFGGQVKIIAVGMGGSRLGAQLMQCWRPDQDIHVHSDYGLPMDAAQSLIVCMSYSGDTAETISAAKEAIQKELPLAIISSRGTLLELAQKNNIFYIEIPEKSLYPRMAIGYFFRSFGKLLEFNMEPVDIDSAALHEQAMKIIPELKDKIIVAYSSPANIVVPANFKVQVNETAKAEAFVSILPEANHNEIAGFNEKNEVFAALFFNDADDHNDNQRRVRLTSEIYEKRGLKSLVVNMGGKTRLDKLVSGIILGDYIALELGKLYNRTEDGSKIIQDFKTRIK